VRLDGKISFPLIGEVQAAGLTASQLTEAVTKELSKSVKNPNVTVVVKEIRSFRIFVLGRVAKPGAYAIKPGLPVLQALTLAGGLVEPAADLAGAFVIRGNDRLPVDLRRLIQGGDLSQNVMIRHEDTIVVPEGGEVQNAVFIMGEVAKPGAYPRADALTVMKLVSMAGGFAKYAAPSRVTLIREMGGRNGTPRGQQTRMRVNMNAIDGDPKANPDIALQPGDVRIVPQ